MKKQKTDKELEEKFAKLLISVNPYEVFTSGGNGTRIYLNGKLIEESEIADLQSQVEFLRQSRLWNVLNETVRDQAMELMFTKSKTIEDLTFGKAMLYNLGVQNKIMDLIKAKKLVDNSKK